MEATTKLQAIEPGMSKDKLYELYLSGRPMFVEVEITHDKSVIIDYLEGIRDLVSSDFEDCYDNVWNSIINDDILGKALWKTRKTNPEPFNRYTVFKILGILESYSIFKEGTSLLQLSLRLEEGKKAETLRTFMSKGLDAEPRKRLRKIIMNRGV